MDEGLYPYQTYTPATCPGPGTSLTLCNPPGTFMTIYDFAGFNGFTSAPPNWTVTTAATGTTPSTIVGTAVDDPGIINVTFNYGQFAPNVQGPATFAFSIGSTIRTSTSKGSFSFQVTKADGSPSSGLTDQGTGSTSVPSLGGTAPPEPASMMLLGEWIARPRFGKPSLR